MLEIFLTVPTSDGAGTKRTFGLDANQSGAMHPGPDEKQPNVDRTKTSFVL